jgi:hypothetical protein
MGFHTKDYEKLDDDSNYYHIIYLLQVDTRGRPILLAIANKDDNLRWKNMNLKIENQLNLNVELSTTIPSDPFDLTFNVENSNPAKRAMFGQINLLPTIFIMCPLHGSIRGPTLYHRHPLLPLMGSEAAKREIVQFKLKNIQDRLRHLNLCVEKLKEVEKLQTPEYKSLIEKQVELEQNLADLDEPKWLEDIAPCIDLAVQHLTRINYQQPVAVEIECSVSQSFWVKKFLADQKLLRENTQCYLSDVEMASRLLDLDTFNGYLLLPKKKPYMAFYYTLLLQVMDGKVVLLAKMVRDSQSSMKLVSHTWKNFNITRVPYKTRKVMENFNSLVIVNKLHDYIFSIGEDPDVCDDNKALIGRTSAIPHLFIKKHSHTHSILPESSNSDYIKDKPMLTEDSFLHQTYKLEIKSLSEALPLFVLPQEAPQRDKTQKRLDHVNFILDLLREKLNDHQQGKRSSPSSIVGNEHPSSVARTLQALDLRSYHK